MQQSILADAVWEVMVNDKQHQVKRTVKVLLLMAIVLPCYIAGIFMLDSVQKSHRPVNEQLVDAVKDGHQEQVRELLSKGADPNYIYAPRPLLSEPQRTPIIQIARNVEIAQILLDHGARVNAKDISGKTALGHAIMFHNTALARFLQSHGAHE